MTLEQAYAYRRKIEAAAALQDDEAALESIELFPKWQAGIYVTAGERYRYDGKLYRVVQSHTTQADWTPDVVPALFTVVSLESFPESVQPTGAHDAYNKGDRVSYSGKHWESTVDGNVWAPDVYGWNEINF
jgi:chitodextrinase